MGIASFYHQQAAQARRDAMIESLEQRRAQYLKSAGRWTDLANEADELDVRAREGEPAVIHPHRKSLVNRSELGDDKLV